MSIDHSPLSRTYLATIVGYSTWRQCFKYAIVTDTASIICILHSNCMGLDLRSATAILIKVARGNASPIRSWKCWTNLPTKHGSRWILAGAIPAVHYVHSEPVSLGSQLYLIEEWREFLECEGFIIGACMMKFIPPPPQKAAWSSLLVQSLLAGNWVVPGKSWKCHHVQHVHLSIPAAGRPHRITCRCLFMPPGVLCHSECGRCFIIQCCRVR